MSKYRQRNSLKSIISILLIEVIFAAGNSYSQEASTMVSCEPQHLFTLSSGMSVHTVRDEMMSPLLYRGTQIPIELSYRFRGLWNRHTLLLSYDNGELNSSITDKTRELHYVKNLDLNLEYSFAAHIAAVEDLHTACFLGARFSSMLNMRNHYFLQDKNHMSAEQMTGLGIYLLTETSFQNESGNVLRVEINIPCISYAVLSNRYNANVSEKFDGLNFEQNILWQLFKKGDVVTFNKLFEVQADVSYIFFVSNHIGFGLQYRLLYYSFAQYQDLFHARVLNNQFLLGLTVKL
jgi:hypothetical protein